MKQVPIVMLVEKVIKNMDRDFAAVFKKEKLLHLAANTEDRAIHVRS
jgi:hypothetical protein